MLMITALVVAVVAVSSMTIVRLLVRIVVDSSTTSRRLKTRTAMSSLLSGKSHNYVEINKYTNILMH